METKLIKHKKLKTVRDLTEEEKKQIIHHFLTSNDNSAPSLSKRFGILTSSVNRVIDNYLKTLVAQNKAINKKI